MAEWVVPVVTVLISAGASLAAVWYSESFRRRVRGEIDLRVAEKRFDAYAGLWALTKDASPMLTTPLTMGTRMRLFQDLTNWYYKEDGSGMLLSEDARNIYLKAKANLTCEDENLEPSPLADAVASGEVDRSALSRQQLSLLRTAIRADLRIFTRPYGPPPTTGDAPAHERGRVFLEACKIDLTKPPWRDAYSQEES